MTLYDQISQSRLEKIIFQFYSRAFLDPIIGHFFLRINQTNLINQQIAFSTNMLGGPKKYTGKSLDHAHQNFKIRDVHFNRRQVLLREVLEENNLPVDLINQWLQLEEKFRPLILTTAGECL